MVLVKNWKFFHVFIFVKTKQENMFEDILGRIKSFFRPSNQKLEKSKNQDFSKGVNSLWFRSKIGNFSMILFLSKSDRKTCLKIF